MFRLFRYRFETPKQTEILIFWFHETNRNKRETDLVSVCFGSNRNLFFLFRGHPRSSVSSSKSVPELEEESFTGLDQECYKAGVRELCTGQEGRRAEARVLLGWNKSFTVLDQEGCRGLSKIVTGLELEICKVETRELQGWSKSVAELGQLGGRAVK